MVERGDERVGDADRQQVVDLLRTHTGAGRLTLDEFSERAGQAFAARTRRELDAVLRELPPGVAPGPAGAAVPGAAPPGVALDGARSARRSAPARRRFVAIMSGSRARGRWQAPPEITAFAFWGGVDIDMRDAQIVGPVVDITAWAIMGGVDVRVPEGVPVELDGMVIMGGATDDTRSTEPLVGAPLVRVHARGLWGGVTLRTARSRRAGTGSDTDADRHRGDAAASTTFPGKPALPRSLADWMPPPPVPPPQPWGASWPRHAHPHTHGPGRWGWREAAAGTVDGAARDAGSSAARSDPDQSAAPAPRPPSGTLTMMVTDIAGSTGMAERLGDRRWIDVLADHNALVREQVARHGGTEVKSQGDGFLVVFSSARRAILAAVDVQRALARYSEAHPDCPVDVRIGLHTGEIVDVDGDVFGQNVVVAVRIADQAAPGEILVSALTRDLTVAAGDLSFDAGEEVGLKGLSQRWRVHRVAWTPEPA
jgi:class 3 adenylate cyclase